MERPDPRPAMSSETAPSPDAKTPPPLRVAMLAYPAMTLLDLAGPQAALGAHGRTCLVWKDLEPVPCDTGVAVLPTHAFDDCPGALDVLFVPGGFGTASWMEDDAVLDFLREAAKEARYVTSVCSGALLLAAAGLLEGYRAATHWAAHEALAATGVEAVRERVVIDRNRVTGGGVTAGIDFGLTLLAELRGEAVARATQLALEYDPAPPFPGGTPETSEPETVAAVRSMTAEMDRALMGAARRARARRTS